MCSEDPALHCLVTFINCLPAWFGGDVVGWARGLVDVWQVYLQAVQVAPYSQQPVIHQFACGMCFMTNHLTIVADLQTEGEGQFDWAGVRTIMDVANESYSHSLHSRATTELVSVNVNLINCDVWPVVIHYGNLEVASRQFDCIVRDTARLMDEASPEDDHTRIFCAGATPFALFAIGRRELATTFLRDVMGIDVALPDEELLSDAGHWMYSATQSLTYVKLLLVLVDSSLSAEQTTALMSAVPTSPHDFARQALDLPDGMGVLMPMYNLHVYLSPCALAAFVFCQLGWDEQAHTFAEEALLGDLSRGGDTIASTRVFALMVRAQLHARRGDLAAAVAAFDEAASIAERVGLSLYEVFALHAWRAAVSAAGDHELAAAESTRLDEIDGRWSRVCAKMESPPERFLELAEQVWRPIGR